METAERRFAHKRGVIMTAAALVAVLMFSGLGLFYRSLALPDIEEVLSRPIDPAPTSRIMAADGTVIMSYGRYSYQPVSLENISPLLIQAVLAIEDCRFYRHGGIDPKGVLRAAVRNVREGGIREGGSTISQQTARILFLSNERSMHRKLKEAILARRLERRLNKEEILSLYLNSAYFGEGAYGVEAASRVYFNKPAANLNAAEAAMLAGLIQAPSRYNPYYHSEAAKQRRDTVLRSMADMGELSAREVEQLIAQPVRPDARGRDLSDPDKVPYFNRAVLREVLAELKIDEESFWQGGYRVYTTLDMKAQRQAERAVAQLIRPNGWGPRQAGLVSLDEQNRIIAYVGGRDFAGRQFDHVRQAHRPAGSLFKVFVYTTAFKHGFAPTTVYDDAALKIGEWEPHNYDRNHRGRMTLAQALIYSNNVIAVKVMRDVKPESVVKVARDMGVRSDLPPYLSLALGAADVTLEEMTGAFSVFRARGMYRQPYAVSRMEDRTGKVLYETKTEERVVLDRTTRDSVVAIMKEVVRAETGRGAQIGRDVAGKTGTSDEHRDAWFIGFTPEVTTGVWVGNDDNRPMPGITGGSIPARIWRAYMAELMADRPKQGLDVAYALPLQSANIAALNPSRQVQETTGSRSDAVQPVRAERTVMEFENRANRIRIPQEPPPRRKAVDVAVTDKPREKKSDKPVAVKEKSGKKRFEKLGRRWQKVKTSFRKLMDDDDEVIAGSQ